MSEPGEFTYGGLAAAAVDRIRATATLVAEIREKRRQQDRLLVQLVEAVWYEAILEPIVEKLKEALSDRDVRVVTVPAGKRDVFAHPTLRKAEETVYYVQAYRRDVPEGEKHAGNNCRVLVCRHLHARDELHAGPSVRRLRPVPDDADIGWFLAQFRPSGPAGLPAF